VILELKLGNLNVITLTCIVKRIFVLRLMVNYHLYVVVVTNSLCSAMQGIYIHNTYDINIVYSYNNFVRKFEKKKLLENSKIYNWWKEILLSKYHY
jgi:hypothetical protein